MSDSLWLHESQHARLPYPSPTPGVYSNSCPSSQWCHPAISSSVITFSFCPQSLPASGSFPMSHLFAWGGQSFLLGSFKLNQSDELSLNKKLTSHLLKGKLRQLWGGSTWLTPGYGHLSLKAPLCWEWLNHTKNDQPGTYETRLGALWTMPVITLRESDWYGTQCICGTNLWPWHLQGWYEGVA